MILKVVFRRKTIDIRRATIISFSFVEPFSPRISPITRSANALGRHGPTDRDLLKAKVAAVAGVGKKPPCQFLRVRSAFQPGHHAT